MPLIRPLLLTCLAALLTQCATKDKPLKPVEGTENSKEGPIYLVGIVEFVNPEQKFVLIKSQGSMPMPPGHALTALDSTGALSELVLSPERKGAHLTADIKAGNPRAGNLVIYRPTPGPGDSASTPASGAHSLVAPVKKPPTSPGTGPVEWRDGQPLPFEGTQPLPPSVHDNLPIIPIEPLPEEPQAPAAP